MSLSLMRACGATAGAAAPRPSPTTTDADRRAVAGAAGTSHAAFLGSGRTPDGGWPVRFFSAGRRVEGAAECPSGDAQLGGDGGSGREPETPEEAELHDRLQAQILQRRAGQ